jgi:CheY-like chemotaxis protein/MinD-like ATPase involved in chromosome partitioning or flagellar assembly
MDETPITVLIIDADGASRTYLAAMLGKSGYSVLSAPSGREGLILAWQQTPQVIIVDPALPDVKADELVARLRQDRRTAKVPCIALSSASDAQEMSRLLSAGFNEYLFKSSQALAELQDAISRLLMLESGAKKGGLLFVFLSAKGGTGTSSLCANIAMCTGKAISTMHVAVIDMVLPIGSIASIVGYGDRVNIVTVSAQNPVQTTPLYFKENLPRIPTWYFRLLAGSPDPDSANQLAVGRMAEIIAAIQESYDYVFVDLGRSLSRISLPIIQKADLLALILSTEASAVTLTRTLWDYLKTQHVDPQRVYPILNRAIGLEGMTKSEANDLLGLQIRATIPYMGGNFALANNRHEAVAAKFPGDTATIMLQQVASEMSILGQRLRNQ